EIQVDVFLGRAARYAQLLGEPERAHAVDEPEVHRLGGTPLLRGDRVDGYTQHLGGGRLVNVLVARECAQKTIVPGQVRHDAQLDLRVVRGQQHASRRRDECLADAPAFGRADRNV